ncbi:MAG: TldD-like protein [Candidatus Proteinoplasmatales archaeon SG8-5]|nr:MAG: TldD-like protein [Candidatus Proteinoplasmatales archaeon SG8-5]
MSIDIDRELAEKAMNKALDSGAHYAEARLEVVKASSLVMKNGNPEISGFERTAGMSIRVLVNGSLGFASTDQLAGMNTFECAEAAVRMAKAASGLTKVPIELSSEEAHVAEYEVDQKKRVGDAGPEEMMDVLKHIDRAMVDTAPMASRFLQVYAEERTKYYANSDGSRIGSHIPRVGMFLIPTIMEGGMVSQAMLQKGVSMGWEWADPVRLADEIGREIKVTYDNMKHGVKPPTGKIDLLLGPEVVGIAAHESCGHPYEADRIAGREAAQAGESFIDQGMLGTRIGSEVATVIDDPTIENSYGYYLYDDEGVKARPKVLIKNGVINEFLHNRETAVEMGIGQSNAAARADNFNREPIVRMSNTFVEPGDRSKEELFEGVKLGVYMNNFMEWNIDDKRFNQRYIGREAYLIENGEMKGPVKAPILEMTTPAFWAAIDAVANDLDFTSATCGKGEPGQGVPVYTGGPSIRLRDVRLGVSQ